MNAKLKNVVGYVVYPTKFKKGEQVEIGLLIEGKAALAITVGQMEAFAKASIQPTALNTNDRHDRFVFRRQFLAEQHGTPVRQAHVLAREFQKIGIETMPTPVWDAAEVAKVLGGGA